MSPGLYSGVVEENHSLPASSRSKAETLDATVADPHQTVEVIAAREHKSERSGRIPAGWNRRAQTLLGRDR